MPIMTSVAFVFARRRRKTFHVSRLHCKLGFLIHPIHYYMVGVGVGGCRWVWGFNQGLGFKIEHAKIHLQAKQTKFC